MEVKWSTKALDSLDENISYLKKEWSKKEVKNFLDKVESNINQIKNNPHIGTVFEKFNFIRKYPITKQITLFYEIDKDVIYLHLL